MKPHDLQFEEFHVPESVSLMFHGFNLAVRALQGACRYEEIVAGKDADLRLERVFAITVPDPYGYFL